MATSSSAPNLPILPIPTDQQLRRLGDKVLNASGGPYRFQRWRPHSPPWLSGGEGKAYKLQRADGSIGAYLKFFNKPSAERVARTHWLIEQRIPTWLPNLAAGPSLWIDTRKLGRPNGVTFDFAASFARAVPGETWRDLKKRIARNEIALTEDFRRRCIADLSRCTARLGEMAIVHGDLSPANIVIDVNAPPGEAALYLIDFDAFVAEAAGPGLSSITGEGCTYGTEGYYAPGLVERARSKNAPVIPETDLYARDMLAIELLFMGPDDSCDTPPREWDLQRLIPRIQEMLGHWPDVTGILNSFLARLQSDLPQVPEPPKLRRSVEDQVREPQIVRDGLQSAGSVAAGKSSRFQVGEEPFPGYRLLHPLGRGGSTEVWAAEHQGNKIALKFMESRDPVITAQEVRAIESMRQLKHPNLIRIHDAWSAAGYVVVSMELAEGSLMDLLYAYYAEYAKPILPEPLCRYMAQAARGIDYLNWRYHKVDGKWLGFQHADIKPANILLFGEKVKITDFGLAVPMPSPRVRRMPCGTVHFAAPEVFQSFLTERSDQYSLAVTYCLLRGGRVPFTDSPSSFRDTYHRPLPDLTMLPEHEQPIIARTLSPIPADRWPTCAAMVEALAKVNRVSLQ
jgi:serine/threonine-protein kinase